MGLLENGRTWLYTIIYRRGLIFRQTHVPHVNGKRVAEGTGPGNNQMVFCFSLCRVSLGLVTKLGLRHRDCKKSRRDVPQLSGCTSAQKCISWPLLRSPSFFENLSWWAQSYSKWIQYTYKIRGRYISNWGDHMYTSKNLFSYSFRAAFSGVLSVVL